MKARLELLHGLRGILSKDNLELDEKRYLLVIKPKHMQEDNSMEAKFDTLKSFMIEQH